MPIYKEVNKNFFKTWTHGMAYTLGFFFADGSLDVNPRGSHYFNIQICDRELLISIRKALHSNHKIATIKGKKNEKDKFRLQIGSREMCDDLRCLGVREQKSYTMYLPKMPKRYLADFVRGYFDGDGNVWTGFVHKNRKTPLFVIHTVFTSCSEQFLLDLQNVLLLCGSGKGSFYAIDRTYKLQYSINDSILLYHLMYDNLQDDLFLNRKKRVFEKYLKKGV